MYWLNVVVIVVGDQSVSKSPTAAIDVEGAIGDGEYPGGVAIEEKQQVATV